MREKTVQPTNKTSFEMYPCQRTKHSPVQYTIYSQLTLWIRIFLIKTFKDDGVGDLLVCMCICLSESNNDQRDKCNRNGERVSKQSVYWTEKKRSYYALYKCCMYYRKSTSPPLDREDNFSFPPFFRCRFFCRRTQARKVKIQKALFRRAIAPISDCKYSNFK